MTDTNAPIFRTVDLDKPIIRGDQRIESLQLRKPGAPEFRGLSFADLARLDVNSIITLLPRITTPPISPQEAATMAGEDLFACSTEIGSFLLQKRQLQGFPEA